MTFFSFFLGGINYRIAKHIVTVAIDRNAAFTSSGRLSSGTLRRLGNQPLRIQVSSLVINFRSAALAFNSNPPVVLRAW